MEGESWKGQGSHPQGEGYILRGPEGGRDAVRFAFYIQPGSEVKSLSRVRLFATPWTQPARLLCSWGFSRQGSWSGLICPPPGNLPDPGIEPRSPTLQTGSLPSDPPGKTLMVLNQ